MVEFSAGLKQLQRTFVPSFETFRRLPTKSDIKLKCVVIVSPGQKFPRRNSLHFSKPTIFNLLRPYISLMSAVSCFYSGLKFIFHFRVSGRQKVLWQRTRKTTILSSSSFVVANFLKYIVKLNNKVLCLMHGYN